MYTYIFIYIHIYVYIYIDFADLPYEGERHAKCIHMNIKI